MFQPDPGDIRDKPIKSEELNRSARKRFAKSAFEPGPAPTQQENPDLVPAGKPPDFEQWRQEFLMWLNADDHPFTNPNDDLLGREERLGPQASKVPADVRRLIRNCHYNLGHPSNFALARLMSVSLCHPDMIAYAREMKCPTCVRRNPPGRIPRATMPYRPTQFNNTIGVDLKWIKDSQGETFYMLNILDLATGFNLGIAMKDKSATLMTEMYKTYWLSWAGAPGKVVADRGREGLAQFVEMARRLGNHFRMVALEAPWQHGMVERHGGVLGDIITAACMDTSPVGFEQMKDVCLHASMAKNRRIGRSGYSPRTLVFGCDERLIASGLNHYLEEPDNASVTSVQQDEAYKKSIETRKAAMKAVVELDHRDKWAEAIRFPSRRRDPQIFLPGNQVFFYMERNVVSPGHGRRKRTVAT